MLRMHFLLALTAVAFLLLATAFAPAIAQPICRCDNIYSQEAWKGGKVIGDKTTTLYSCHSGSTVYLRKGNGDGLFWEYSETRSSSAHLAEAHYPKFSFNTKNFLIIKIPNLNSIKILHKTHLQNIIKYINS